MLIGSLNVNAIKNGGQLIVNQLKLIQGCKPVFIVNCPTLSGAIDAGLTLKPINTTLFFFYKAAFNKASLHNGLRLTYLAALEMGPEKVFY